MAWLKGLSGGGGGAGVAWGGTVGGGGEVGRGCLGVHVPLSSLHVAYPWLLSNFFCH